MAETQIKIDENILEVTKEVKTRYPKKLLLLRKSSLEKELAKVNSYLDTLK